MVPSLDGHIANQGNPMNRQSYTLFAEVATEKSIKNQIVMIARREKRFLWARWQINRKICLILPFAFNQHDNIIKIINYE